MSTGRIATRYARPLLELAEEKKVLDGVKADMELFSSICTSNRDFLLLLKSPIIAHLKKAEVLKAVFKGKVNELTMSVFDLISRKNRESVLPEVATEFVRLYNEKMGFQQATVTTTFALDASLRKSFEKLVKDVTGKKPVLKEQVDENIIGGYTLQLDDRQIDESISGSIRDIKLKFQKENNS
ncbi:MAG: ATP synthase F1 subunit delta [Cyclobacteriaceae bacterium]|nr:ATP synthase F1 subunit delta [Cyclobacteriaceae bacterium HetDA_MAG_MS6]